MLHIVNTIHVDVVSPLKEPHAPPPEEQPNLLDMMANYEDAYFDDHLMDVVQQAQTIVKNE